MTRGAPTALLLALLLHGCGTTTPATCPPGATLCGEVCVDFRTDEANCGGCGVACGAGQLCRAGQCAAFCSPGFLNCGGACVDPLTSRTYCGAKNACTGADVGAACAAGEVCANGACAVSCQAGFLNCGGTCVDPLTSRAYCGAKNACTGADVGAACASGEVCADGACAVSCPAGFLECGGTCVDPLTSRAYCGAKNACTGGDIGATCGANEVCAAGACVDNDATLSSLTMTTGTLSPQFAPGTPLYVVSVPGVIDSIALTPTATSAGATVTVNGTAVASGSPSAPIPLAAGGLTSITVRVTAPAGGVLAYGVVVVRGEVSSQYLKASNTGAGDEFGNSVALSGDTLAVGALRESSNATGVNGNQADNSAYQSGAVYVFTRTGGVWTQQAYLKASNTGASDNFGTSVALFGDTLAVGATGESSNATGVNGNQADDSAPGSGAVYVFTRTAGVWTQQAYLKASNTGTGDDFGRSVALSGDTLAVGAHLEASNATGVNGNQADDSASGSGAVYVFTRTAGVWAQQAYLKASNTGAFDYLGWNVALFGDTLAVGANGEASNAIGVDGNQADNSASGSGAVYVFTRTAGVWTQQAYLKASNTGAADAFGRRVALFGDTLAVGAFGEDSSATGVNGNQVVNNAGNSGAVYVFTRTAGVWTQQAYLKASNTGVGDLFGVSVALYGDTLAVGALGEDSSATHVNGNQTDDSVAESGAVYVFTRTAGVWTQQAYVKASNTGTIDTFGYNVALSGDTLAVGAYDEDSNATGVNGNQADNSSGNSGAAYVWTP